MTDKSLQSRAADFIMEYSRLADLNLAERGIWACQNNLANLATEFVGNSSLDRFFDNMFFKSNRQIQNFLLCNMADLHKKFSELGVPLVFLKGPLLGYELFGTLGKRRTSDIDIYVPFESLPQTLDI